MQTTSYSLGANVEVYIDNENNFKALFYQDQDMRDMFDCYPEILLVDATLNLPQYVMLVVDGNGESEIVGLMLAADEQQETVRQMIIFFKNHNPKWREVNCIMARQRYDRATGTKRRASSGRSIDLPFSYNAYFLQRSYHREDGYLK